MAFLDKVFAKREDVDIEDILNNMDVDVVEEDVDFYVKPIILQANTDVEATIKELKDRNLVLLDIENITKRNAQRAKQFVGQLKMFVADNGGDMAMLSKNKLLLVPSKVKIVKKIN